MHPRSCSFQLAAGSRVRRRIASGRLTIFSSRDVPAEEPCEVTVRARVIAGFEEHALGRGGLGVGTEADPGLRDPEADVVLAHEEVHRVDPRVILDDEIDDRVLGAGAAHRHDLGERLSRQRLERRVLEADELDAIRPPGQQKQVLLARRRVAHLLDDARPLRGILEPLNPGVQASRLYPERHRGIKTGGASGVGVHVGRHRQPGGCGPARSARSPAPCAASSPRPRP